MNEKMSNQKLEIIASREANNKPNAFRNYFDVNIEHLEKVTGYKVSTIRRKLREIGYKTAIDGFELLFCSIEYSWY
jgi:transcription initiation factor IIE alpha subunit